MKSEYLKLIFINTVQVREFNNVNNITDVKHTQNWFKLLEGKLKFEKIKC